MNLRTWTPTYVPLAEVCELCHYRHGIGRPCLTVRLIQVGSPAEDQWIERFAERNRKEATRKRTHQAKDGKNGAGIR